MSTTHVQHTNAQAVDPVIVEIIRNGLFAVTEEMKTNLMRTAYNLIIYEALDFTKPSNQRFVTLAMKTSTLATSWSRMMPTPLAVT